MKPNNGFDKLKSNRVGAMALKAHRPISYFHLTGIAPTVDTTHQENPFFGFSASQFVVHLLYNLNKPISENLILKRIRENKIYLPYARISDLVVIMLSDNIIETHGKKGYVLTLSMKALVEQQRLYAEAAVEKKND